MKKRLLLSVLSAMLLCLCACGSSAANDEVASPSTIPETETSTTVSADEVETESVPEGQAEPVIKYLPSRIITDSFTFYYDERIEYDEKGLTAHEFNYDRDENLVGESTVSRISDTGRFLDYESIGYDYEGNVNSKNIHTSSEDGSSSEWIAYDGNDVLQFKVVTEYDEYGNVSKSYNYDKDGNQTYYSENYIEYDDQNRRVFSADKSDYVESENYTGYSSYTTYEYKDGKTYSTNYYADSTTTSNDSGTTTTYSGTVTPSNWQYTEYEYDENGNKTAEHIYSKYSESDEWNLDTEVTYEYIAIEIQ